jgi:iron complex transport system substrate-binding protein
VVTQDLCAVCAVDIKEVDAALEHLGCRAEVLTLDPMTLDEVLASVELVGHATGRAATSALLVEQLRFRLETVAAAVAGRPRPKVAVLEWTDPPFSSGHWVPDMVTAAGGRSVLGTAGSRSAEVSWAGASPRRDPDVIVVAPCGYRLAAAPRHWPAHWSPTGGRPAARMCPVWAVDADAAFVRPGPRIVDGVETLAAIVHPGSVPLGDNLATPI